MTHQLIEIKQLDRSPLNVRKTDSHAAMEELKASILAHGLMQNLVVIPAKKGKYEVVAGGRRLEALRQLRDEGKLPDDHAVQCQVADQSEAAELSLAENTVRQAMHPADEFEAFAALSDQGKSAEQIAQRFGIDEKHVLQRLKLGRAAPELLKEYRAAKLSLESLMAFTISDDRKRQLKVYKSLEGWQKNNARHIRERLTDKMVKSNSKLAAYVGLKAYQKAGGLTRSDLFGEDVFLEDSELVTRLATEKLKALSDKVTKEGWGWIEVNPEHDYSFVSQCSRIQPEPLNAPTKLTKRKEKLQLEYDEIEKQLDSMDWNDDAAEALQEKQSEIESQIAEVDEQLEEFLAYDPVQQKQAGCYITIDHSGKASIDRGLVKPQDKKKLTKAQGGTADGAQEPETKNGDQISQSLKRDLETFRLGAAQSEIAKHPQIAYDLLVFKLALDQLDDDMSSPEDGTSISCRTGYGSGVAGEEAQKFAESQIEAAKQGLPVAWMEPGTEAEQFNQFRELPDGEKHRLLAFCVAASLKPKLGTEDDEPTAYDIALSLTGGNPADYWRPTKDNYLSRINREQLLAIGGTVMLDGWVDAHRNDKKGTLVALLDKAFADSGKPDTRGAIKNWLPKGMGFHAEAQEAEPVKTAKKGRNAKAA